MFSVLFSLIHAYLTISLRANQVVSGLALTMLGVGLSSYFGTPLIGQPLSIQFKVIPIPILCQIPFIGEIFFKHNILVYSSYIFTIVIWIFLYKTRIGLQIRAVGEAPLSSETMGVNVAKIRYLATIFGGFMSGLAGAYLALSYTPLWVDDMTSGRGWIAIALVIFSNWNPIIAIGGAYLFGSLEALQLRLQAIGVELPIFLLSTIPYLFTIIFLIIINIFKKGSNVPKSLGLPFFKEERK